jgi:glutamine---fructose-6-phosphate transaminase (isomerizing)
MSVASTKAFHAQVAAGAILSLALARVLGTLSDSEAAERARELKGIPALLREVLALDGAVAKVAADFAPTRRHWTVVGSGLNRLSAEEVRIKCSELCYKSISADTVEDKKHIDLSSESLMVVFAAGSPAAVRGDLVKDVAIFQAHKALPVVFAERGDARFDPYAAAVIPMPPAPPRLAMLANVMAGHLFAYHAARAVDEGARFFSRVRASVVAERSGAAGARPGVPAAEEGAVETARRLRAGRFESALGPGRAADLALLLQAAATGIPPVGLGTEGAAGMLADGIADSLVAALTDAVRELERPVDAIRHQAKIVTVGTSRTAERPAGPLFDALEEAGVPLDEAPAAALAAIRAVQPAVGRVEGWARYRVEGLPEDGAPTDASRIVLEGRGGVSSKLPSRAEGGAPLKGTKRSVVASRRPFTGIGAKDGRTLVILPLLDARLRCTALALLHVEFRADLPVPGKVALLGHRRLEEIVDGVSEADVPWTDALLGPVPPKHLACLSTERIVEEIVARARGGKRPPAAS